jgi:ubiquinone/menaquinone biosynthesis C-methylase UbiE
MPFEFACLRCHGSLADAPRALRCRECGNAYPRRAGFVDFLSDEAPDVASQAALWDAEATTDEVAAAAALPKHEARDVFVKLPPLLRDLEVRDRVLLDIGCGYGRTLLPAARDGAPAAAVGVDVSAVMLGKARLYSNQMGLEPALARASVTTLPLAGASVDVVYSSAVMLHLPKSTVQAALREVHRVLRPGGTATFEACFLGWANPDGLQQRVITTVARRVLRTAFVRTYGRSELEALVASTGPWRSVEIAPEAYKVVPTVVGTWTIPAVRSWLKRINAAASARLRTRAAFVTSWSVQLGR